MAVRFRRIASGECNAITSQRSIATRLGLSERYVGRVLECAFLARDIVEAILDGRQPSDLTFQKLTGKLPLKLDRTAPTAPLSGAGAETTS
jgi:DNA-binding transcriptional regulator LsrR (DeoR family)